MPTPIEQNTIDLQGLLTKAQSLPKEVPIVITKQPRDIVTNSTSLVDYSVEAVGSGLTYLWQFNNGTDGWANSTTAGQGTKSISVQSELRKNGWKYRCIISDSKGNSLTSQEASYTFTYTTLEIVSQPVDVYAKVGDMVHFVIGATGEGVTYQWQVSNDGGSSWSNSGISPGRTNDYYFAMESRFNGRIQRCVIEDSFGNSITSNVVTLTEYVEPALAITAQPISLYGELDEYVSFSVGATGKNVEYQWQYKSTTADATWTNCPSSYPGYKSSTMQVQAINARNNWGFRCIVSDGNDSVASNEATLTIHRLQSKTQTPSKTSANVIPDTGFYGLSSVVVNPIPDNYIVPSGSTTLTENGTFPVTEYAEVVVDVPPSGEIVEDWDADITVADEITTQSDIISQIIAELTGKGAFSGEATVETGVFVPDGTLAANAFLDIPFQNAHDVPPDVVVLSNIGETETTTNYTIMSVVMLNIGKFSQPLPVSSTQTLHGVVCLNYKYSTSVSGTYGYYYNPFNDDWSVTNTLGYCFGSSGIWHGFSSSTYKFADVTPYKWIAIWF